MTTMAADETTQQRPQPSRKSNTPKKNTRGRAAQSNVLRLVESLPESAQRNTMIQSTAEMLDSSEKKTVKWFKTQRSVLTERFATLDRQVKKWSSQFKKRGLNVSNAFTGRTAHWFKLARKKAPAQLLVDLPTTLQTGLDGVLGAVGLMRTRTHETLLQAALRAATARRNARASRASRKGNGTFSE